MPEKLEVNEEAAQLRLERQLRVVGSSSGLISGPPSIGPVGRSSILENVKRFLPEMAKADEDLQQRIESGENLDIEGCSGDLSCIDIRGATWHRVSILAPHPCSHGFESQRFLCSENQSCSFI